MGSVDGVPVNEHKHMSTNLRNDFAAARNRIWSSDCIHSTAITSGVPTDGHSHLPAPLMAKSPVIYARGAATMANLLLVEQAGCGLVDVAVG